MTNSVESRKRRVFSFKAYARLFVASFRANLASAMEYRGNFLLQVFGMMLNNACFALFWGVLIDRVGTLAGYSFNDVMYIWALTSSAFGLHGILFVNARRLAEIIRRGELDVYLLQPKNPLFNVLVSKTSVAGWGDFAYGFIVLAFIGASLGQWLAFVSFVVSGALVFTGFFVMTESLTFFMGSSAGITRAATEFVLSFSLYPDKIFPSGMRWAFYSIVPSGFVAFLPLAFYRSMDFGLGSIALASSFAYSLGAALLFRAGLRRYESGNKIGARD